MKEYYLVPIKDFNEMQSKCIDTKTDTVVEKLHDNNKNLPPNLILDLVQNIKNLSPKIIEPKQHVEETKQEIIKDENEKYLQFIPFELRGVAKLLIDKLLSMKNISIDNYGLVTVANSGKSMRFDELLLSFLIKNKGVRENKTFIQLIIDEIPDEMIKNKRVLKLKEKDVFYDSVGGSVNFSWIHCKCKFS